MSNELYGKIVKSLLLLSTLAILGGALFKIQHWSYGNELLKWGILANLVLSAYEISRLRKIISKYAKSEIKVGE